MTKEEVFEQSKAYALSFDDDRKEDDDFKDEWLIQYKEWVKSRLTLSDDDDKWVAIQMMKWEQELEEPLANVNIYTMHLVMSYATEEFRNEIRQIVNESNKDD